MANENGKRPLPEGWVWTTLGEVTDPSRERVQPREYATLPFVGMDDVSSGTMQLLGTKVAGEMSSSAEHFRPDDVLYGSLRPYLNKVYRPDFEGLCSAEFIVFRSVPHLASKYLQYFLNQWEFVEFINRQNTGDRPRVKFAQMADYSFPLPPLPEQQRIVAEIEKQFTRLDAAVAALKRARAGLARYKAAVLKAAVEGRLVPQDAADEPASELLGRILAERRRQWTAANPGKQYVEPKGVAADGLPELPEGWVWATAEQISWSITKGTTPSSQKLFHGAGDVPYIKVYNLTFDGSLNFNKNPTFVSHETHNGELSRSRLWPGDVLMNIVGPPLGKVSIVPHTYPQWNMNQAIAVFRPLTGIMNRYLALLLQSEAVIGWATKRAKATAGQFNLTLETCRELPLPVASLAVQERIVQEVERLGSVTAADQQAIDRSMSQAIRLRQAVLGKAFRGELV